MKNIQYLHLSFYLNDQLVEADIAPGTRAIDFIREQSGLVGTKESCSEGDCGACTIAIGRLEEELIIYRAVTSCIFPAAKLHGTHVITVEGLAQAQKLHLIQQMLLESHATQCGYCTPGIVMSMFCLFAGNQSPSEEEMMSALEGNLCRCTGYHTIYEAACAVVKALKLRKEEWQTLIFPDYLIEMPAKVKVLPAIRTFMRHASDLEITERYLLPKTLDELFQLIETHKSNAKFITGGTDLIVEANLKNKREVCYIDVSGLEELDFIIEREGVILIGAATTYQKLFDNELIQEKLPGLCEVIRQMASKQIRNIASFAGNIAHASPVADGVVGLLGLGASVSLKSKDNERVISLDEFYKGYQKTVLQENEVIAGIEIPIPKGYCGFEKGVKRVAVDISKVCSFVNVVLDGNVVISCRIAFGGVGEYPTIAKKNMKKLMGKELTEVVIEEVANSVYNEFKAVVETRSEPEYRKALVKNHMIKHLTSALNFMQEGS